MKAGIELLDRLAINGSVVEMNFAVTVRIGRCARGLQEDIGCTADRIVGSGERLHGGKIRIFKVSADSELTIAGEMAMVEGGRSLKLRGRVVSTQIRTSQRDGIEGEL